MNRFFQRIFFSMWLILLATATLTIFIAGYLPDAQISSSEVRYDEQMVALVARDLRRQIALDPDPTRIINHLMEQHLLDFNSLMQIYVLDPAGNDLLQRPLPIPVRRFTDDSGGPLASSFRDPRLMVQEQNLNGYKVVGFRGAFPLNRVLVKPGSRILLFVMCLIVSAVVSFALARFVVLPIKRLRDAGHKVAAGDLSVRVAPTVGKRTDDIAQLARDFDLMTQRINVLLQSQKRLMRDVSHELRSPLARLQALLSIARQNPEGVHASEIDRMEVELERLDDLIGEILSFARLESQETIERHPTDLVDLTRNIVDYASIEGEPESKIVALHAPEACLKSLDSALIHSAIENVVRNAIKFTAPNTTVEVSINPAAESTQVVVEDRGPGVPEEALLRLFDPFYRFGETAAAGVGGLGLAIADRSIRLHGGEIFAQNRQQGGLRIEMTLPA